MMTTPAPELLLMREPVRRFRLSFAARWSIWFLLGSLAKTLCVSIVVGIANRAHRWPHASFSAALAR